jgi:hypothetical protein
MQLSGSSYFKGFIGCLSFLSFLALSANGGQPSAAGALVTIHTTRSQQYELALDELQIEWGSGPGPKEQRPGPAQSVVLSPGQTVLETEGTQALLSIPAVATPGDLLPILSAVKSANPGCEVNLVLYEPGLPRGRRARQFLTREVGLLMEKGIDSRSALDARPAGAIRPVPGVPEGYVLETPNPLAALERANALYQQPGVRSAYPLLKRYHVKR